MSQIDNHMKWCLKEHNRLKKIKPDLDLAKKHLDKSEYNVEVMRILEKSKKYDWAINVGFYSIYHCFLSILSKFGYESKNQSCTITTLLQLIEDKKIKLDKELVFQFDTLEVDASHHTIRESREISTYGVKTEIDTKDLYRIKDLIIKIQRHTINILNN